MPHRVPKNRYFDFAFPCLCRRKPPKIDGALRGWHQRHLVPDLMSLDGSEPYADVYLAWHESGIYLGVNVMGKVNPITVEPEHFWDADCLEVWLDMRDARAMHHASRYCHQFVFLPAGGGRGGKQPTARQIDITRGPGRGKVSFPKSLQVAVRQTAKGYAMEVGIPAGALHGFDPVEHPRIGFTYHLNDTHLGSQWWSVDRRFRFYDDPSMWGTAVLKKG